jgi:hypothetical protein
MAFTGFFFYLCRKGAQPQFPYSLTSELREFAAVGGMLYRPPLLVHGIEQVLVA